MKLVRADGHQQQQWALTNVHTCKIAKILCEHFDDDNTLIKEVASILQKFTGQAYDDLDRKLANIRDLYMLDDPEEISSLPAYISELLYALHELYYQPRNGLYRRIEEQIDSLRGAVVELIGLELIKSRYSHEDECANSRCFVNRQNMKITLQEVDIAAISFTRHQLEAYECKMKAISLMNDDCIDLKYLYEAAEDEYYQAHVGIISLDPTKMIIRRLRYLCANSCIQAYGVDMLGELRNSPFKPGEGKGI